jgi:hypothetical protein
MEIKTFAGYIHSNIDVDLDKEYSYTELKELFKNIDGSFSVVQNNTVIYNNLYNIIDRINTNTKLTNLTIIIHPYKKEDLDKIKYKYRDTFFFGSLFKPNEVVYRYKPKEINNLTTEFELSEPDLDDDQLFMLYCVNLDGIMLSYASKNLQNDKELVYYAYTKNPASFQYASDYLKNDKEFIEKNFYVPIIFKHLQNLRNDKEIAIKVLKKSFTNIKYIGPTLINDKEFIFELFKLNTFDCSIIKYFNNNFKNDKAFIMKCIEVQKNNMLNNKTYYFSSLNLEDIGSELQRDRDIIIECLKCDGTQLKTIADLCWERPEDYQLDNELILIGLNQGFTKIECDDEYEDILEYFNTSFRRDKNIVIAAIRRHGNNYHYASKRLKNDPEVIIEAINNCWYNIYEDDKKYCNKIGEYIKKIDEKIQKILNSTKTRSEQISNAVINKLRKQYI